MVNSRQDAALGTCLVASAVWQKRAVWEALTVLT